jgi:hypothetical protein
MLVHFCLLTQDCLARSSKEVCLKRYDPQQLIKGMYAEFVEVGGWGGGGLCC